MRLERSHWESLCTSASQSNSSPAAIFKSKTPADLAGLKARRALLLKLQHCFHWSCTFSARAQVRRSLATSRGLLLPCEVGRPLESVGHEFRVKRLEGRVLSQKV